MIEFADPVAFWGLLLVQACGLASILLGRTGKFSKAHDYCRGIYLGCLFVLASATLCAVIYDSGWWAWFGTTLSVMAVGGTLDVGQSLANRGF